MNPRLLLALSLLACGPGSGGTPVPRSGTPTGSTGPTTGPTTGSTSDSGTPTGTTEPFTWDCTTPLPTPPVGFTPIGGYSEAEDFDFHPDGWAGVVTQSNLVGKDRYGGTITISPNVTWNAASTRVLSTGDWAIADNDGGSFILVDHASGAKTTIMSGMSWPNGIEVGANDDLFVSDFSTGRVLTFNAWNPQPVTEIDTGLAQANGVVLSPDEQTLYVVLSWTAAVYAYDRQPSGDWVGPRTVIYQAGGNYQGIAADYCGNLYITDVRPGGTSDIIRVSADETQTDILVTVPSGYVPNAHFGNGVGGWDRFKLYASDREDGRLFEIDAGVPGKNHPALP